MTQSQIKDVNKTEREISIGTEKGTEIRIGNSSRRILIGVFFKNVHLSMHEIQSEEMDHLKIRFIVENELKNLLKLSTINPIVPYSEAF